MGTLVLVAEGLCAPDQQQQQRKCIIDGEQRILALCLILAASRACLLESSSAAGFEAAKQIRLMLVQVRCRQGLAGKMAGTRSCIGPGKGSLQNFQGKGSLQIFSSKYIKKEKK